MIDRQPSTTEGAPDALLDLVARALERRVRSELGPDGDDIELVGLDADRIVQVRLAGGCCSSAAVARLMMVDAILRDEVPEVRFVEAVP